MAGQHGPGLEQEPIEHAAFPLLTDAAVSNDKWQIRSRIPSPEDSERLHGSRRA